MLTTKIKRQLNLDPVLRPLIKKIKLTALSDKKDVFASLIRSIISQQLSVKAAETIYGRFMKLFSRKGPTPKTLLKKTVEELRVVGLSKQKANYVLNVAQTALNDKWQKKDWDSMSDEEVSQYLCEIKGVGPWTAQMILLFCLHRPDVFPIKDLVVYQVIVELYGLNPKHKTLMKQIEKISEEWRPYRSYASRYFWAFRDLGINVEY